LVLIGPAVYRLVGVKKNKYRLLVVDH
jgi:hypothetical protein